MALRKIPVRSSANRPNLVLGGDRELVMLAGLLAAALIFSAMTWHATAYGVGLWFAALFVLREMAKADPLMRPVYRRHRHYCQRVYLARATPFRVNTRAQRKLYQ